MFLELASNLELEVSQLGDFFSYLFIYKYFLIFYYNDHDELKSILCSSNIDPYYENTHGLVINFFLLLF